MADNKNQHYVPKCYLRAFSPSIEIPVSDRADINLYNIRRSRFISRAPIKSQCSKNYYYGADQRLEKFFCLLEGGYSQVLGKVLNNEALVDGDVNILKTFCCFQYLRTDKSISDAQKAFEGMYEALGGNDELNHEGGFFSSSDLGHEKTVMLVVGQGMHLKEEIKDLDYFIAKINNGSEFVTSDHPVFFTNKFYLQKLRHNTFGFNSAGALLFMPLSPTHVLVFYDSQVYKINGLKNESISVDRRGVNTLNKIQFLNAKDNIYLKSDLDPMVWKAEIDSIRQQLPLSAHEIQMYKEVDSDESGAYFVEDFSDQEKEGKFLMHERAIFPWHTFWIPQISYRLRPVYYVSRNGMQYTRRPKFI